MSFRSRQFAFGYDPAFAMNLRTTRRPHTHDLRGDRSAAETDRHTYLNVGEGAYGLTPLPTRLTSGWIYMIRALAGHQASWIEPPSVLPIRFHLTAAGAQLLRFDEPAPPDLHATPDSPDGPSPPDTPATEPRPTTDSSSFQSVITLPKWEAGRPPRSASDPRYWYWFIAFPVDVDLPTLENLLNGQYAAPVDATRIHNYGHLRSQVEASRNFTFEGQAIELHHGLHRTSFPISPAARHRLTRFVTRDDETLLTVVAPIRLGRARQTLYDLCLTITSSQTNVLRHEYWVARTLRGLVERRSGLTDQLEGESTRRLDAFIESQQLALGDHLARAELAADQVKQWLESGPMFFAQAVYSSRPDAGRPTDAQLEYVSAVAVIQDRLEETITGRDYLLKLVTERRVFDETASLAATSTAYVLNHYVKADWSALGTLGTLRTARSLGNTIFMLVKSYISTTYHSNDVGTHLVSIANGAARLVRSPIRFRVEITILSTTEARYELVRYDQPNSPGGRVVSNLSSNPRLLLESGIRLFTIAADICKLAIEVRVLLARNVDSMRRVRAAVFTAGAVTNTVSQLARVRGMTPGIGSTASAAAESLGRSLSVFANLMSVTEHLVAGVEADDRGDTSVAMGRRIAALGSGISTLAAIVGLTNSMIAGSAAAATGTAAASSFAGPIGIIGAAIGLVGWYIYEFTQDDELEQWTMFSSFGSATEATDGSIAPHWAMGTLSELRPDPERQRRALLNLLYAFRLSSRTIDNDDANITLGTTLGGSGPLRGVAGLQIECGSFTDAQAHFVIEFVWSWSYTVIDGESVSVTSDAAEAAADRQQPPPAISSGRQDSVTLVMYPGLGRNGSPLMYRFDRATDTDRFVRIISAEADSYTEARCVNVVDIQATHHGVTVLPVARRDGEQSRPVAVDAKVYLQLGNNIRVPACRCGHRPSIRLYPLGADPVLSLGDPLPAGEEFVVQRASEGHG